MTTVVEHTARRPDWICTGCAADWPCAPAKVNLSEEYGVDRVGLAVHMSIQLHRAAGELPTATAGELYERFVKWTR